MSGIPIPAVLLACVQMISVDRVSATGALPAGVRGEARRVKSELLEQSPQGPSVGMQCACRSASICLPRDHDASGATRKICNRADWQMSARPYIHHQIARTCTLPPRMHARARARAPKGRSRACWGLCTPCRMCARADWQTSARPHIATQIVLVFTPPPRIQARMHAHARARARPRLVECVPQSRLASVRASLQESPDCPFVHSTTATGL